MPLRKPKNINKSGIQSKFYGVTWKPQLKKWATQIKVGDEQINLKHYNDDRVAATIFTICTFIIAGQDGNYDSNIGIPEYINDELYIRGPMQPHELRGTVVISNNIESFGPIPKEIIDFCQDLLQKEGDRLNKEKLKEIETQLQAIFPDKLQPTVISVTATNQPDPILFSVSDEVDKKRARRMSTTELDPMITNLIKTHEYELTAANKRSPAINTTGSDLLAAEFEEINNQLKNEFDNDSFLDNLCEEFFPEIIDVPSIPRRFDTSSLSNKETEPYTLKITSFSDNILTASVSFRGSYYVLGLLYNPDMDKDTQAEQIKAFSLKFVNTIQGHSVENVSEADNKSITAILQSADRNNDGWQNLQQAIQALESPSLPVDQKIALAEQLTELHDTVKPHKNTI